MIHFDLPKEKSSILKVIGVGGGGSNAVNHMFSQNIENVNFIICNTDAQAIAQSKVPNKIQLGPHLTQGLGAGANPEIGKQATEESLEEIKRILEVNTKMAFITAGMGGGTGTGGAPIISKICKDLDILTVGIVTTPFAYEGKKRQQQAEEGIEQLKQYVDTLLVISNDKLRHQFGNLKMKDAFAKADNVLATAAKCITDVINSTGQINVDFADVCTVMRNGGVAILGSAVAEGDSRAQKAIEEALSSPLLNDNDIRGAKWILININSSEGDHEFTMDEVEVIQTYLLSHAGDETDVILGLGYDNTLERKIGITLIATGFEHKSPFYKREEKLPKLKKEEKVVMTLNLPGQEVPVFRQSVSVQEPKKEAAPEVNNIPDVSAMLEYQEQRLMPKMADTEPASSEPVILFIDEKPVQTALNNSTIEKFELVHAEPVAPLNPALISSLQLLEADTIKPDISQSDKTGDRMQHSNGIVVNGPQEKSVLPSSISGGYLAKPARIYAEPPSAPPAVAEQPDPEKIHTNPPKPSLVQFEEPLFEMQLVIKDDVAGNVSQPAQPQDHQLSNEQLPVLDEIEDQKRRANERIQKLRNLSFNINGTEANNEFDSVPAYIRRNLELYNTVNSVENFYSNYAVKSDENNKAQISTINTFLDGKKPD